MTVVMTSGLVFSSLCFYFYLLHVPSIWLVSPNQRTQPGRTMWKFCSPTITSIVCRFGGNELKRPRKQYVVTTRSKQRLEGQRCWSFHPATNSKTIGQSGRSFKPNRSTIQEGLVLSILIVSDRVNQSHQLWMLEQGQASAIQDYRTARVMQLRAFQ